VHALPLRGRTSPAGLWLQQPWSSGIAVGRSDRGTGSWGRACRYPI